MYRLNIVKKVEINVFLDNLKDYKYIFLILDLYIIYLIYYICWIYWIVIKFILYIKEICNIFVLIND